MKCKIPEISWHNRDPVLSVDIQPNCVISKESNAGAPMAPNTIYRLASGGTDAHVLIWYINRSVDGVNVELELAADLSRHQRAVNTVRWSPNGELLASGDDESVVFIWKQKEENEVINIVDDANEQDKEVWITLKVLRGHTEDIYDLSWSPNSQFLVTGSVDNTAMMWDVHKGKSTAILDDHKGYVQGVAWDPKNHYIATMSTDRHMRVFDLHTRRVLHRISKSLLPVPEESDLHGKSVRLYHDGTLQTYFRRLSFTPDGKLLLTPAGVTDYDGVVKPLNTTYAYSRCDMRQPAFVLPCPDQYTVAVRCSPILYQLRPHDVDKNPPILSLPYRMIFAVATKSSVYFYDTQQKQPFAVISNIHYTRLTDLTWSSDGLVVVVSSTDGFCSLITFNVGELGKIYEDSEAVLGAAVMCDNTVKNGKKIRKQKMRKGSTDEFGTRKPLQENLNGLKEDATIDRVATPIEIKHKSNQEQDDSNDAKENASTKDAIPSNDNAKKQEDEPGVSQSKPNPIAIRRKEATPIAIKRKPGPATKPDNVKSIEVEKNIDKSTITTQNSTTTLESTEKCSEKDKKLPQQLNMIANAKIATPTAVKRRASTELDDVVTCTPKKTETKLPITTDIIILDKQILSSEEKFESPEKKSRPVTPISVRRHPRTPNSNTATPTQTVKRAQPIAVRRTPRVLIATPVNAPTVVEEAMDAWPLEDDNNKPITNVTEITAISTKRKSPQKTLTESNKSVELPQSEVTSDRTEDIRLVYEDTVEETPQIVNKTVSDATESVTEIKSNAVAAEDVAEQPQPKNAETPNNKTPRRVAFKTISTPKSKKKILE